VTNPLTLLAPGPLETRTGGYEYDRRVVAGLRAFGWSVETRELDGSFPYPTRAALDQAASVLASLPAGSVVLIDGLALGAMPDQIERESSRLRIVALVHLPLAAEIGLDQQAAARFRADERRALLASALTVVTGRSTVALLADYGIPRDRIVVVEPGTERARLARGSENGPLQLLCVATVNRGKGHAILFRALRAIRKPDWYLTCAGSLDRDPPTVQRLRDQLRSDDLEAQVTLAGAFDEPNLSALYDRADLFVLPTLLETYGMAVAEAVVRGLPVVSTRTGAIPELVGDAAGMLVTPGDEKAFAEALGAVIADRDMRLRFADGARRARERLPTWDDAAMRMSAALTSL
jgi:glycosyltransferase involved in cell wall biosynthesis